MSEPLTEAELTGIEARAAALPGAVMNLPVPAVVEANDHAETRCAYKEGHRDARHAAADLATAAAADVVRAVAEIRRLRGELAGDEAARGAGKAE